MTLTEELQIRSMTADDLGAVIAMERESESAPHWNESEYLGVVKDSGDSALRRLALVVELGDCLAGFAVLRLLTLAARGEAELESIVIAPGLRRRGLGAALLAEVIRRAAAQGARRLDLEVRASNTTAVRLYERSGFLRIGSRPGYYRDPEDDAVLMSVNL